MVGYISNYTLNVYNGTVVLGDTDVVYLSLYISCFCTIVPLSRGSAGQTEAVIFVDFDRELHIELHVIVMFPPSIAGFFHIA